MIQIKDTEPKWSAKKRSITLKDIIASELCFVDSDGEILTQKFLNALPEGVDTVTLKATFEIDDEHDEEVDADELSPEDNE